MPKQKSEPRGEGVYSFDEMRTIVQEACDKRTNDLLHFYDARLVTARIKTFDWGLVVKLRIDFISCKKRTNADYWSYLICNSLFTIPTGKLKTVVSPDVDGYRAYCEFPVYTAVDYRESLAKDDTDF